MVAKSSKHSYRITFPHGDILYQPLEGIIYDLNKKQTTALPSKRVPHLFLNQLEREWTLKSVISPVCLTIYTSHQCNLNCTYCYIPNKETFPVEFVNPDFVEAGAQLVAENCKKRKVPFIAGFHGGNEPLLYPDKLEKYLSICESAAKRNNIKFLPFCTSNGVISKETAIWAAKRFKGITLSWDGPPELHDYYRRDVLNNNTSNHVEHSAQLFSKFKKDSDVFLIRCTITSMSVNKMKEIVCYFHETGIKNIEFYPVFRNKGSTFPDVLLPEPESFVFNFLKARDYASSIGINTVFSGSRLKDIHNRYCMILQDNLTITPDGFLTNCFHFTHNSDNQDNLYFYGKFNSNNNQLVLDEQKLNEIIGKYSTELDECKNCFNQFHCSHGCPELCPFSKQYQTDTKPDCIKEKWLGLSAILENSGYSTSFENKSDFIDFFQNIEYRRMN